jgi:hypothetical protein
VKTLSKVEKLRLIETLWADLSAEDIASPRCHQDALLETERLHAEGKAMFSDWSEAKERIRAAVSARLKSGFSIWRVLDLRRDPTWIADQLRTI